MSTAPGDLIRVEVAFALADRQFLEALELPTGTTAAQAVAASGLFEAFPEAEGLPAGLGVFSKPVKPDHVLSDGDRVEVYRALVVDPKESRRRRAARKLARD